MSECPIAFIVPLVSCSSAMLDIMCISVLCCGFCVLHCCLMCVAGFIKITSSCFLLVILLHGAMGLSHCYGACEGW